MLPRKPPLSWRFAIALQGLIVLAGCVKKVPAPVVAAAPKPLPEWPVHSPEFRDLVPGPIRQITPVVPLRQATSQLQEGNTITLIGTDFQGYETAMYQLKPREDGRGVAVELESVETTRGDDVAKETQSRLPLLQFPAAVRYIRLLYLLRVSEADHNMAVLASDDVDQLNDLTKQVQANPDSACKDQGRSYCRCVPAGVALN